MLAAVTLAVSTTEAEEGKRYGPLCGAPLSRFYNGGERVEPGTIVKEVKINGAERVDGVTIVAQLPRAATPFHFHAGGDGGDPTTLPLDDVEYITPVGYNLHKNDNHHTRLFYLQLTTNKNKTAHVGQRKGYFCMDEAPYGYQLSSFYGFEGDELDMAGAFGLASTRIPQLLRFPPKVFKFLRRQVDIGFTRRMKTCLHFVYCTLRSQDHSLFQPMSTEVETFVPAARFSYEAHPLLVILSGNIIAHREKGKLRWEK
ncbi:hypothetical protein PsorP6_010967 [Peronosclerospora sorghi]|uniref:Uncharacterized protein n=1 Tax=Peronosclerospora sorghi TaxID=230839 RepID=A0ACC0VVK8_9STRA|nr:hypothetical protein PsorP6_010967 [Peronosclerospora sorghi]